MNDQGDESLYSLRGTSLSSKHLPCSQKLPLLFARSILIQGGANKDNFGVTAHQGHRLEEAARAHHNTTNKASPKPSLLLACFLAGPCHGHKKCPYSPDSRHLFWGCTRATNWKKQHKHTNTQQKSKPNATLALGLLLG